MIDARFLLLFIFLLTTWLPECIQIATNVSFARVTLNWAAPTRWQCFCCNIKNKPDSRVSKTHHVCYKHRKLHHYSSPTQKPVYARQQNFPELLISPNTHSYGYQSNMLLRNKSPYTLGEKKHYPAASLLLHVCIFHIIYTRAIKQTRSQVCCAKDTT